MLLLRRFFSSNNNNNNNNSLSLVASLTSVATRCQRYLDDPYGIHKRRDRKSLGLLSSVDEAKRQRRREKARRGAEARAARADAASLATRVTRRQLRIARKIRTVLENSFEEQPGLRGNYVIDSVQMTRDLRTALVYWSSWNSAAAAAGGGGGGGGTPSQQQLPPRIHAQRQQQQRRLMIKALDVHRPWLRRQVAANVPLKYVPYIAFQQQSLLPFNQENLFSLEHSLLELDEEEEEVDKVEVEEDGDDEDD